LKLWDDIFNLSHAWKNEIFYFVKLLGLSLHYYSKKVLHDIGYKKGNIHYLSPKALVYGGVQRINVKISINNCFLDVNVFEEIFCAHHQIINYEKLHFRCSFWLNHGHIQKYVCIGRICYIGGSMPSGRGMCEEICYHG